MIRSGRIPPVLNRICDDQVPMALLVTYDGELLGSSNLFPTPASYNKDPESLGTLLADIAVDYRRLGQEYAAADSSSTASTPGGTRSSRMDCLLIQLEGGLAAAAACDAIDCFVLAVAKRDTPPGLLRARIRSLADHIQESMSLLMEGH